MLEESELAVLVSNVVSEIRFSHCRLCLKSIEENYVHFDDFVLLDKAYVPLSLLLTKFMGPEDCEEIAGIDAVCIECVEKMMVTIQFLRKCEESSKLLKKLFNNVINALSVDIDTDKDHKLYINVKENDTNLIFVKKTIKKKDVDSPKHNIHVCTMCTLNFNTFDDFKEHNITEHMILTCDKCSETFTTEEKLTVHETNGMVYKCPDCAVYKCTAESLKNHSEKLHDLHVCKQCGRSFRGYNKLHKHEEKHITKSECPKCGKVYNTKEFFLKHVKLCLEDLLDPHPVRSKMEKKYFCSECSKGYSTPGGLRVHNRFVHGNAKPHTCRHCNKQFTAPSYLKIHMVKHTGEKNFNCDICPKKFVSKEALLYHTRRHTGEKPYSCTKCEEKFVNASARAEHIKFKHVGPTLMCEICSRKFVTRNFLRLHMKKHHDPSNKLYSGRIAIPPNIPAQENMRVRLSAEELLIY